MEKVLVTGGAGFIGTNLVKYLNSQGCDDIIIADELGTSDKWKNLTELSFKDYIHFKDINNTFHFDYIFHLGACSSTTETDADYLIRNNYEFSKQLLHDFMHVRKFVYASSAATYGSGKLGFSDRTPINQLKPLNMYGYSKHLFDLYIQRHFNNLENVVGLKYFNIFGPHESHKENMCSVVYKAVKEIGDTKYLKLFKSGNPNYKDGEQERDFLYVKDAVKFTTDLALQPRATGVVNVGSGNAYTWNYLAECIFDAMGVDMDIKYIDMPDNLKDKYQYHTKADVTKLSRLVDNNITDLRSAVKDYVQNYLL